MTPGETRGEEVTLSRHMASVCGHSVWHGQIPRFHTALGHCEPGNAFLIGTWAPTQRSSAFRGRVQDCKSGVTGKPLLLEPLYSDPLGPEPRPAPSFPAMIAALPEQSVTPGDIRDLHALSTAAWRKGEGLPGYYVPGPLKRDSPLVTD